MGKQKDEIIDKRETDEDYAAINWNNDTLAPGNDWDNYVFPDLVNGVYIFPANHEPYIPSLGTVINHQGNYYLDVVGESSGIDCAGLVFQAQNYIGNPYDYENYRVGTYGVRDNSWSITNQDLIVPGDIIIEAGNHVAIIQSITYSGNTRTVNKANVTLIEAAIAWGEFRIINSQNWNIDDYRRFTARRIKTLQ